MPNVTVYVVTNWQNLPTKTSPIDSVNLNHLETGIKNVTDFLNTINAESGLYLCATPFLSVDRTKLDGIEAQANKYVLPTASNALLGGVKVDGVTINIDQNGVISSVASSTSLENLTDVNLDNLSDGQILKYDSENSKWVNATNEAVTTLANLTDTEITSPTDGQVLKYDAETGKWINGTGGGGGASALNDLSDVDLTAPAQGQVLKYNGTEWVNDEEDILSYNDTLTALGEPAVEPSQDIESYQMDLVYDSGADGTYAPKEQNVNFIKSVAEYDELLLIVQPNTSTPSYWFQAPVNIKAYTGMNSMRIDVPFYFKRYILFNFTNTTFYYESAASDESADRLPAIRKIYGIKYNCMSVNQISRTYKRDLLWGNSTITHPPTPNTDPVLSSNIENYDAIEFIVGFTSSGVYCFVNIYVDAQILKDIPTASTGNDKQIVCPINTGTNPQEWIRVSKGSSDNIIHIIYNGNIGIYQIYGIKY